MGDVSLEARAKFLGIPMQITVTDDLRYSYCSAHMANLTSIEGTRAIYSGECANGHNYEMEYEIEELKRMVHIENGQIVFGDQKGFKFKGAQEY